MTSAPFAYGIYGLSLLSNRPLSGFASPQGEAPQVTVDFAGAPGGEVEAGPPFCSNGFETLWHRKDGSWLLRYVDERDGAYWTVEIDAAGSRLTVRWTKDSLLDDIPTVLQGPGLAAVLHQRGVPVLHAAVLAVDDAAVALIGASGAGKSTTAAAFLAAGFACMSDDLGPLAFSGSSVLVQPGCPRLRLSPDSATAAGLGGHGLPRLFAEEVLGPKRYLELSASNGTFLADARPLRAIYYLMPRLPAGCDIAITALSQRQALPVLLQNLYATRFLGRAHRAPLIRQVGMINAATPVRTVQAANDLASLPRLVEAIVRDAAGIVA